MMGVFACLKKLDFFSSNFSEMQNAFNQRKTIQGSAFSYAIIIFLAFLILQEFQKLIKSTTLTRDSYYLRTIGDLRKNDTQSNDFYAIPFSSENFYFGLQNSTRKYLNISELQDYIDVTPMVFIVSYFPNYTKKALNYTAGLVPSKVIIGAYDVNFSSTLNFGCKKHQNGTVICTTFLLYLSQCSEKPTCKSLKEIDKFLIQTSFIYGIKTHSTMSKGYFIEYDNDYDPQFSRISVLKVEGSLIR